MDLLSDDLDFVREREEGMSEYSVIPISGFDVSGLASADPPETRVKATK